MSKHGEKEFETIDMDILVFLKFGGGGGYWAVGGGENFLIGVFGREKLILGLADY